MKMLMMSWAVKPRVKIPNPSVEKIHRQINLKKINLKNIANNAVFMQIL